MIDKFHCKITDPATGKPVAAVHQRPPIRLIDWPAGWNSDFNGASATSMVAHTNAKGTGFSAVATYQLGS